MIHPSSGFRLGVALLLLVPVSPSRSAEAPATAPTPASVARAERLRSYWERTDFPARIDSVRVTADRIHFAIHAAAPPSGTALHLAEIRPHEDVTQPPQGRYPRAFALPVRGADGALAFDIQRVLPVYDQIFSKWAVIARSADPQAPDTLLSHAVHGTDLTAAAARPDLPPVTARTKKGLAGIHPDPALFPDLVELGIGHLTHNITLGSLLREKAGPDTLSHDYAGRTYHFAKAGVATIDRVTSFAHQHGIVVSAIILVPNLPDRQSWAGRVLTHPEAHPSGIYSLANVATFEGITHYAAAMRFLAERYSRPDSPLGRIAHWIIHNEVDSGWVWTNAGHQPAAVYLDDYAKSMRIAYQAVRSYDPLGKVHISLTHNWTRSHLPKDPRFFPSRHLLGLLNRLSRLEGDFEWGLAFHPYPQSLFHPRTWEDVGARNDPDSPYITFRNIEVLDRWMQQPAYRYQGKTVRTILLSEQGFHTPDTSETSQATQAAALAYAWKKIAPIASIEAFHYHRWIDHEREGGLNLGLWTVKPGTITLPLAKKKSWEVFRALDTPGEAAAVEFAKPIIGIEDWSGIALPPAPVP
ncbi:MAG: hypothetical protein JNK37_18450 [Verrucomicrobiales bacterium]|nr:hypothetical protein [Verrucomicrobiales bacterium]